MIYPGTGVKDPIGVLIPSLDGLHKWKSLYVPLLEKYYPHFKLGHDFDHNSSNLKIKELTTEESEYVWSTRVRVLRNFENIGHTLTQNNNENLIQIRAKIKEAFNHLPPIKTTKVYDAYFWNDAETIQYESKMIWY